MPFVPVEDLKIHPRENDLIIGTHGRSIWITDISYLEELSQECLSKDFHLFRPEDKVLYENQGPSYNSSSSNFNGESEESGTPVIFYINQDLQDKNVRIEILDDRGVMIYDKEMEAEGGVSIFTWNQEERIRKRTEEELQRMERQLERWARYLSEEELAQRKADMVWVTGPAGAGRYTAVLKTSGGSETREFELVGDHWR
jgi:hypothetical protein